MIAMHKNKVKNTEDFTRKKNGQYLESEKRH